MPELDTIEKLFQEFLSRNGMSHKKLNDYKRLLSIFKKGYESHDLERAIDVFAGARLLSKLKQMEDK